MLGNAMYEVARERIAEQQRVARLAGQARAAARARRAAKKTITAPVIPDFAHEMFGAERDAVPSPRREDPRDRHAGASR